MSVLKSKIIAFSFVLSFVGLLLLANTALGITPPSGGIGGTPVPVTVTSVGGLVGILTGVVMWIYIIFFVIAVLFILLAAFGYLTAAGDAEKLNTAKNRIIYAVVAIVVALLAYGVDAIIRGFVVAPGTPT